MLLYDMFFFFKQKTAYEVRISDWSSDVCSSDLACHCLRGNIHLGQSLQIGVAAEPAPVDAQRQRALRIVGGEDRRRSEERRVGKECVSTCRSRWSRYH